jgi:hypothetical protein
MIPHCGMRLSAYILGRPAGITYVAEPVIL